MSQHTAQTKLKLIGKLILAGELHCETGLHIGAGKGSLEIGKLADVAVLDRDILGIDPSGIAGTKVIATEVGGVERHRT